MRRKLTFLVGAALLLLGGANSCAPAKAETPRPPAATAMVLMAASTPDTLHVFAKWNAATVARPTGPITYQLTWTQNGVLKRSATITSLADTVKFGRATFGTGVDTLDFTVKALYLGRNSGTAALRKIYPNGDTQVPSTPVITSVDTL